jgi:hypothetical protein
MDLNPLISTIMDIAPKTPHMIAPGIDAIRNINLGQNDRKMIIAPAPTAAQ